MTCTFSPGPEGTFAVPAGVASVQVVATGQGGAANFFGTAAGGAGAQVTGDLDVRAGSTLFVEVAIGGGAAGNHDAGRGGGESDVRTCSTTDASCPAVGTAQDPRLIVAGGGGGSGCCNLGGKGGAGGIGTNTCDPGTDGMAASSPAGNAGEGGKGGGCASGGAGGSGGPGGGAVAGGDGTASSGGTGGNTPLGGGGGGGGAGFFGGGGGGGNLEGGGGGGGSSFGPKGSVFAHATTGPQVVISYTPTPTPTPTPTATPSAVAVAQTGGFDFRPPLIGLTVIVINLVAGTERS